MDPESKQLLKETLVIEQENNRMLKKLRNAQRWSTIWQVLKILIFVGITFGAFYFLQPFLNKALSLYTSVTGTKQSPTEANKVQDLLKGF